MESKASPLPPGGQATPGLLRVLGLKDVIGIVVGSVIGSGIFIVPAAIAMEVKSPWLIMAVWVVGGVLTFFGALSFSELGGMFPQAGGMYVYLRESYGPLISFLFGWTLFLVIDSGSVATLASAFATKYLPHFVTLSPLATKVAIVGLIAFLVTVNYLGVRWGALLQNLLTLIKMVAIVGVTALVFLLARGNTANFFSPAPGPISGTLIGSFGIALVACLWAYKGWEAATFSTGEVKNPERNLYLGLLISSLLIILLYLAANLAYLYVFPAGKLAMSSRIAAHAMAKTSLGVAGASIVSFLILFSIAGAANANVLTSPRVYYAMARDGLFFKKTAEVHPRFRTPHWSIVFMGIWSTILAMSGTFEQLATYVVFGQWIFFGLTVAAVIILRRNRPDLPRPYKAWGYPVVPILFILAAFLISVSSLVSQFYNALAGLLLIFLGIPVYRYWQKRRKRDLALVFAAGAAVLALILVLTPAGGPRITILYDWMDEVRTGVTVEFPCNRLDQSRGGLMVTIGGKEAEVKAWKPGGANSFSAVIPDLAPGQYEVQILEKGKSISTPERKGLMLTVKK